MKKPHICPVCAGNGLVPNGFYRQTLGSWSTSDATPETCRSCNGAGYVVIEEINPLEEALRKATEE